MRKVSTLLLSLLFITSCSNESSNEEILKNELTRSNREKKFQISEEELIAAKESLKLSNDDFKDIKNLK